MPWPHMAVGLLLGSCSGPELLPDVGPEVTCLITIIALIGG